jgi:branched-subunit amino acid transport protein
MRDIMIVALVGAGTLAMRSLFLVGGLSLPERWERRLGHAKPAILAALVGGFLAGAEDGIGPAAIISVGVAWLVARTGRSMLVVLGSGMAVALVLQL